MTLWTDRDEFVLRHLAANPPYQGILYTDRWGDRPRADLLDLSEASFHRAVMLLGEAGYLAWGHNEGEGGGGWTFQDFQVTGTGKQVLGLWPRFDALGSPGELADLLAALSRDAATEEERTNLQHAAESVRRTAPGMIRNVLAGALQALARSQLGL